MRWFCDLCFKYKLKLKPRWKTEDIHGDRQVVVHEWGRMLGLTCVYNDSWSWKDLYAPELCLLGLGRESLVGNAVFCGRCIQTCLSALVLGGIERLRENSWGVVPFSSKKALKTGILRGLPISEIFQRHKGPPTWSSRHNPSTVLDILKTEQDVCAGYIQFSRLCGRRKLGWSRLRSSDGCISLCFGIQA